MERFTRGFLYVTFDFQHESGATDSDFTLNSFWSLLFVRTFDFLASTPERQEIENPSKISSRSPNFGQILFRKFYSL